MTHTPGPWIAQEINDFGYTFDIYSEVASTRVGTKYTDDPIALYVKYRSNAVLIAAAPELLEACQAVVAQAIDDDGCTWCDHATKWGGHEDWCPIPQTIAAIAKARGEQ